jgi:NADH dehydrogenase FAD-containing subunit
VHVRLIEMAPDLLTPFDGKLREYSKKQLENRGVELPLSTKLKSVDGWRVCCSIGKAEGQVDEKRTSFPADHQCRLKWEHVHFSAMNIRPAA